MDIENLASLGDGASIETDLVIIGGGPAGLTVAREFFHAPARVLILESGLEEERADYSRLNGVESVGEPASAIQRARRADFHGANAAFWSDEGQAYGVRCRVLGGSSHAWAGKVAAFNCLDFAERPWVPHSGWPFPREALDPFLDRAGEVLNLGPNRYGEDFWALTGGAPSAPIDGEMLKSWFWQFARSRVDRLDLMRFGPEFAKLRAPNVRVLVNATVTHIDIDETGSAFTGVEARAIDGARVTVRAKAAVLAAGAIENARLLLVSRRAHPAGLGNGSGLVGRFLMDHPGARIGRFGLADVSAITRRFGFYGVRHRGRVHMYMHGLALSEALQRREGLLHAAAYMMEERAPDDPWDALKRLLRRKSENAPADMLAVASSPGLLAKGIGMKALESNAVPQRAKDLVVNGMIRLNPNFVAREFQNRGLPHKLTGIVIDGITEQAPDPESRITLADRTDALGVPLARVDWRIGADAFRSLMRLGHALTAALPRAGLPAPVLEDWIVRERLEDAAVIDMAHSCGTTRMSADPARGVVDADAQVHGVKGLYVAGGSVFPTSGHANPTLMIVALAIRLAGRIKADFKSRSRPLAAPAIHSRSNGMRKTILVTGAAGLIGRHLVPELQHAGYGVRATYRTQPGGIDGVEWRHLDLLDDDDFREAVEGCEGVIHLAAELSDPARMHRINVEATAALLQAAQAVGVRYFGYASSIVVHGSPRRRHVDETTALLDPDGPLAKQYHAEPYMREYARSKVLAERAIAALRPDIPVDIYRPTVVVDEARLLEAGNWSRVRKLTTAYRRTQYVTASDIAAAITHLAALGLGGGEGRAGVEAWLLADGGEKTYRDLLKKAYRATGDQRYRTPFDIPVLADLAKDTLKYRDATLRYPLGMLRISNAKLLGSGFQFPVGLERALDEALAGR